MIALLREPLDLPSGVLDQFDITIGKTLIIEPKCIAGGWTSDRGSSEPFISGFLRPSVGHSVRLATAHGELLLSCLLLPKLHETDTVPDVIQEGMVVPCSLVLANAAAAESASPPSMTSVAYVPS